MAKTSELIKALQEQVEKHGDMEIYVEVRDSKVTCGHGYANIHADVVKGKNVFRLITKLREDQKVVQSRRKNMVIA